ncbi:hypothetical protein G7085_07035 [Tessaracoccus sp. HDW20]|uniref:hypothetical protein n=1 Tax=Tessaracoccus coleopterorum TaxID=2714950 RepID=UPI0018D3F556|nr:hypothetical protein [Tessaracoccus coleopterorum]NHB84443.1 hypothetical protein [Tessaracoccus coleopterorum]
MTGQPGQSRREEAITLLETGLALLTDITHDTSLSPVKNSACSHASTPQPTNSPPASPSRQPTSTTGTSPKPPPA